jgi:cholesterol oxidase
MNRLSSAIQTMQPHYGVVVVGSGYGGAIAASRMARAGRNVCLLERGREFMAGEFPSTAFEGAAQMQYNTGIAQVGSPLALLEVHVNPDVNAVVGCGLGGTSLINANVALKPDPRLWDDPRWPAAVRADAAGLAAAYARAEAMLQPSPVPEDFPPLPKLEALALSAKTLGMQKRFSRPPITVTFKDGKNAAGVEQKRCVGCGDCNAGCNYEAKNSTHMNYLPDAVAHGAQIFTGVAVHSVTRDEATQQWRVRYQLVGLGREIYDAPDLFVRADIVILSAGTLGSTAILLRSREAGLPLSDALGQHFTGNGDVLAFAYNTDQPINGIGWGAHKAGEIPPVGPTITGLIDHRDTPEVTDGFVIEEGSLAGPVGLAMMGAMGLDAPLEGVKVPEASLSGALAADARIAESLLRGPYHGAMNHTQTYLVMAHDDDSGQIRLDKGRARIHWPNAGKQPIYSTIEKTLEAATVAIGGEYVRDPISNKVFGTRLVTVHPLGGCAMADTAAHGVVNQAGQVYSGQPDNAVHAGLYVMDGAVVPLSLGVNPLLTISALAERNCAQLAAARGWHIDYTSPGDAAAPPPQKIGLRFTETMVGTYEASEPAGAPVSAPISFTLTVESGDLEEMLANPQHAARTVGTLTCAALSSQALTIADGTFNLFVVDKANVGRRNMNYAMTLESVEGPRYFLTGQKIITRSSLLELWSQTNTVYAQIRASDAPGAPMIGKATLIVTPENFLRQMRTIEVTHAPDLETRLQWTLKFGQFFAGVLFTEYGSVAAPLQYLNGEVAPRLKRTLRAPAPELSWFNTAGPDSKTLRLTRYHAGDKGPVLLIHGSGVSSRIFSTDLIDTNLVEYLCAARYDVWLIDLRVSVELPSAFDATTADVVAREDIPAAVAQVRKLTGAPKIQVVAHCFGAITFTMALLSGLEGVRSALLSQVSAHPIPGALQRVKAGLHMPQIMEHLGVRDLTVLTRAGNWPDNLLDEALRLFPVGHEEGCGNALCHRATFLYGLLYEHAQLNGQLHANLQELFGVHDIALFNQLAAIVRTGHLVDAAGQDVYLPNLERMNLPLGFIHGSENRCYLPVSTETTFNLLVERFGAAKYERHVIPGYGHLDCIFGKNAAVDVYPVIADYLDRH